MDHLLETRYWYHIPTQGSFIQLWEGEPMEVSHVIWKDWYVKVVL